MAEAPRWSLTNKHYLTVPGTEWEYKEITREGKQGRKLFSVPLYLDPEDPSCHNYPGEVIVAYEGSRHQKDIIFVGDPTPDMTPLNDEAEAISASFADKWKHPIEALPGNFGASLLMDFERQLEAIMAKQPIAKAANVSAGGVDPAKFAELQEQVKALADQNATLQAKLLEQPTRRA